MLFRTVRFLLALPLLSFPVFASADGPNLFDPPAVYLTWQKNPESTMTIHWHTDSPADSQLQYKKAGENEWRQVKGSSVPMPDTSSGRTIHTVELTKLKEATDYTFRFGAESKEFKFRTMPKKLSAPIRFVEGGDVYHKREWMDAMNTLAGKMDPAFIAIGGDLAYANIRTNTIEAVQRWYDFFDSFKKNAVTPDGRLIPMFVTLGNHEVKGFWGKKPDSAPCFYALFATPGKQGYNVVDFGKYMSLFLLDSGHTHPIAGEQTEWLRSNLSKRKNVPHLFPIYHVPAFPSVREYDEGENADLSQEVRHQWTPLFEKYGVKVSFEHHDHAFKRTHPIRDGKVDRENGTVYVGDGAWGVGLRSTHPIEKTWYLEKAGKIRHFYLVTISPEERLIQAVNESGEIFDQFRQPVKKK